MGLLIRLDRTEHVLRSVGDPPNGVLCLACPDKAMFVVDANYQPAQTGAAITIEHMMTSDGLGPASTPVAIADVLDGCEGMPEMLAVVRYPAAALASFALHNAEQEVPFDVVPIRAHVDFLEEFADELKRRGILRPMDDGDV